MFSTQHLVCGKHDTCSALFSICSAYIENKFQIRANMHFINFDDRSLLQYIYVLLVVLIIFALNASLYFVLFLKKCGDIESNPGPYTIRNCVQARFSQGDPRFGDTRGIQCTCISLYGICFSAFKNISRWMQNDLDCILEKGDQLFKAQRTHSYLSCPQLPRQIKIGNLNVEAQFLDNYFGFLGIGNYRNDLIRKLSLLVNSFTGIIFIISYVAFSIIPCNRNIYIVDSHARDSQGRPSPFGTAVILKFDNFVDVADYIINIYYISCQNVEVTQYEIQYIEVDLTSFSESEIRTTVNRHKGETQINSERLANVRRKRAKKNSVGTSQENSHSKKLKQEPPCIILESLMKEFNEKLFEGPFYICVVCNRCLYKKSVRCFSATNYNQAVWNIFLDTSSFDGKKYICLTCDRKVKKNIVPCQSVTNKLNVFDIPNELGCLNKLEVALISKRLLFKKISIMPKGQMPKLKGAICNVPISVNDTTNNLPRTMNSSGIVLVKLKKKLQFSGHVYFEAVSPENIFRALHFLKNNNTLYRDVKE